MKSLLGAALALACLAETAAQATTVTVKTHIQISVAGTMVDKNPGDTFDATDDQVAQLLPIGAIALGSGGTGSANIDFSANAAAIPGTSPLVTIPVNPARADVEVQNQSTSQCQLVRDDGNGNSATSIILAPAGSAGGQGAGWSSTTFRGRVRVWCASSGAQVAAYQD